MASISRGGKTLTLLVLAALCGGLTLLWPNWRAELRAQNVYSLSVPVDIHPRSCPNPINTNKGGVLPVAILGTADVDVSQIDPDSILLEGVSPVRWAVEDVATPFTPLLGKENALDCTTLGPDGRADLVLKFDAQQIVAALGTVKDGKVVVLSLTGNLKDEFGGAFIEGEDVVIILKKK